MRTTWQQREQIDRIETRYVFGILAEFHFSDVQKKLSSKCWHFGIESSVANLYVYTPSTLHTDRRMTTKRK
jgi:hypothetical protein